MEKYRFTFKDLEEMHDEIKRLRYRVNHAKGDTEQEELINEWSIACNNFETVLMSIYYLRNFTYKQQLKIHSWRKEV